jgi:hypothetical protein
MHLKERPAEVNRATALLSATLVIGMGKAVADWQHLSRAGVLFTLVVSAFNLALFGLLFWKIHKGRNWARITFLVLLVLGLLPYGFMLRSELHRSPWLGLIGILQTTIQLYAVALLCTSPGKEWFRPAQHSSIVT